MTSTETIIFFLCVLGLLMMCCYGTLIFLAYFLNCLWKKSSTAPPTQSTTDGWGWQYPHMSPGGDNEDTIDMNNRTSHKGGVITSFPKMALSKLSLSCPRGPKHSQWARWAGRFLSSRKKREFQCLLQTQMHTDSCIQTDSSLRTGAALEPLATCVLWWCPAAFFRVF